MTSVVCESGLELTAGFELPVLRRTYTHERWAWGEEGISVGADDEDRSFRPEKSIHSDLSLAASQGLPGQIATGALLVNWVSAWLVQQFGISYFGHGGLQLKFVRPVLEGEVVSIHISVREITVESTEQIRCDMEVRVDSSSTSPCAVGQAIARIQVGS